MDFDTLVMELYDRMKGKCIPFAGESRLPPFGFDTLLLLPAHIIFYKFFFFFFIDSFFEGLRSVNCMEN